jgi:hypothetical protein
VPLVTVRCPSDHEPFEVRVQGGEAIYTVTENAVTTFYVEQQHLTAVTNAITAAIPSSTVTARPE